jgi:protein SCO1/2
VESTQDRARRTGWRGVLLETPVPVPAVTLTDMRGQPFHLASETAGSLTLLFFGYTNCPDICPVHLSNLAAVLPRFPWDVRSRIRVVFVTVDPERDTPERMRTWLERFGPGFTGLLAAPETVDRLQQQMGLPPAVVQERRSGGAYDVGHAAAVLAITPDGLVRVSYPFGTRQADWLHDLPRLLRTFSD